MNRELWRCPNCRNLNERTGPILKCEVCLKEFRERDGKLVEVKRVRRDRLRFAIPLILIFIVFSSFTFIEYTSDPRICESCHVMEPYFDAWNESTHKDVKCYRCHYGKGIRNFLRGSFHSFSEILPKYQPYRYLSANISDENCIQCHRDVFSIPEVTTQIDGEIIHFNHSKHLLEYKRGIIKLTCVSCHSEIVIGSHIAITNSTCMICHFEHTPSGFPVSGCPSCHPYPAENVEFRGINFSHQEHISREIPCEMCHTRISIKEGDMEEKCKTCHPVNMTVSLSPYDMHRIHVTTYKVKCLQCHPEIIHRPVVKKERCEICHRMPY